MASKYTKELLEPIVKESISFREVSRRLGLANDNRASRDVKPHILRLEIDFSHFNRAGRRLGKQQTDAEVFVLNSTFRSYQMVGRLKKLRPYECVLCANNGIWLNEAMTLEVDHINGKNRDNRLENLRFLCPNCHSIQPTSNGKKRKDEE